MNVINNELTPAEISHIQNYLPSYLAESMAAERRELSVRLRSRIVTHLATLLEATTSHLPETLVAQIERDPVPGKVGGHFVTGTLLFADISGFTTMSEQLAQAGREGAEEVTAVVNQYFNVMATILEEYEGDLIRYGGDALLGLFVEGESATNSPTRAAQAAMKMQEAMQQFAETQTSQGIFPLKMSVALHKGRFFAARLGNVADMEFTLFGLDVNRTAIIETMADAGQVLLDQETLDAIEPEIICHAVPIPAQAEIYVIEYIDRPPLPKISIPMETHFPLPPSLDRIWRLVHQLDTFTPYLPVGLLARLTSAPLAPSLKGEHRLVANLFANIDGMGELADRLGSGAESEIVTHLNSIFNWLSHILHQFGGVLNKIDLYDHGEKFLVTFGAPVAHEDDAERAVRAAIALQNGFPAVATALQEKTGLTDLTFNLRIGISYGYVFAGYVGGIVRHEYTVMGDEVNLAARLMSISVPGTVIVNEHIQRRVQTMVRLEPKGEVTLKGKAQPIPIFRAERIRAVPSPVQGLQGRQSPLVGREKEWKKLLNDIRDLQAGNGRIVSVIGEAGVGKTRLIQELQAAFPSQEAGDLPVRWLKGRCLSYTESVSYTPFQELVHDLLGLTTDENADLALQQIRQEMSGWLTAAEVEENLPIIANFLNLPMPPALQDKIRYLDGEALQRRTYVALRSLITGQAQSRPLLIMIDGIHWMDRASLDLLEYLMPLVQELPLILFWLFRPDREKGCWSLRRQARQDLNESYYEIGLYGLSHLAAQQMLLNLVPVQQWPPGVADLILNRVEGNPLYLEEVIRSLINDGVLHRQEDGRWQFSETIKSISLPDTLEGVLLARLDRLEELCRWTVQVASVVGRSFPFDVLTFATEAESEVPIDEFLTELQLVEIIREAQRNPELVYSFIHTLMQEVSYNSLAASARRKYHRLIAQYLEDSRTLGWGRTESLLPLIAHHAFAGGDWSLALTYQMAAGDQAKNIYANQEAIDHFEKALFCSENCALDAQNQTVLSIHLSLSQLYIVTGRYEEADGHLSAAYAVAEKKQFKEKMTNICRWYAQLYELRGEYEASIAWIGKGLAVQPGLKSADIAQMQIIAGVINIRQGNFESALEKCNEALYTATELDDITTIARGNQMLGVIYLRGESDTAITHFQKAIDLYQTAGHIQGQGLAHNSLANAYFNLGRWSDAEYHYLQAHYMLDQIGDKYHLAMADNNLGGIALKRAQYQDALLFYQEGLKLAEQIGSSAWMVGAFHMNLGATYLRQNEVAKGRGHLQISQEYFEKAQSREFLPELLRYQAEASLAEADLIKAAAQIQEALQLAAELEMPDEEGIAERAYGQIQLAQGNLPGAEQHMLRSVALLQNAGEEYELAHSRTWLAKIFLEAGQAAKARPLLDQAQETFRQLEANKDADAVNSFQAQLDAID